ncbi:MAG TPA: hypothetical protein VGM03_00485 [Phycisphaerae bacterium]|jgi:hypothetical protein
MIKLERGFRLSIVATLLPGALFAAPVGTSFTFQGRLTDGGSPVNGSYDLQFSLWNAAAGGAQVGSTICSDNVTVTNGLFTVAIDFGASAFDGEARWVQLGARPGASGACAIGNYTILSPRQPLTAAPYALGVRLPLSESVASGSPALSVTNTGTGRAAFFESDNPTTGVTALRADTNSNNTSIAAMAGVNFGLGRAGHFEINNAANGQPAVFATTNGSGPGLRVQKSADTLDIDQNSINTAGDGLFGDPLYLNDASGESVLIGAGGGNCGIGGGSSVFPLTPLHVDGGADASVSSITSGYVLIGDSSSTNIVMDNNEIMARNNGATSTLYLNNEGGDVVFGGAIDIGYEIVTSNQCIGSGVVLVSCSAGKRVLGGGCFSSNGEEEIERSYPTGSTGWECGFDSGCGDYNLVAYAICANVK